MQPLAEIVGQWKEQLILAKMFGTDLLPSVFIESVPAAALIKLKMKLGHSVAKQRPEERRLLLFITGLLIVAVRTFATVEIGCFGEEH